MNARRQRKVGDRREGKGNKDSNSITTIDREYEVYRKYCRITFQFIPVGIRLSGMGLFFSDDPGTLASFDGPGCSFMYQRAFHLDQNAKAHRLTILCLSLDICCYRLV